MRFSDFHSDIMQRTQRCGTTEKSQIDRHPKHADAIVAAAAKVIASHEPGWMPSDKAEFSKEVWHQMGLWTKIIGWIASIFIPGGPIWLSILEFVLPYIFEWMAETNAAGLCDAVSLSTFGDEAEAFLKKEHHG